MGRILQTLNSVSFKRANTVVHPGGGLNLDCGQLYPGLKCSAH